MCPHSTSNFNVGFLKVIFDSVQQDLVIMFPTKRKANQLQADWAAKRGLSAVKDLFM